MVFTFDDSDLDDIEELPPSPCNPLERPFSSIEQSTPTPSASVATMSQPVNGNVIAMARTFAVHKKLRPDQMIELEGFLNENAVGRDVRLCILHMELNNKLDKIIVSQPPWTPSDGLLKNIGHYVAAVFFSCNLSAFRGDGPTKLVTEKLVELALDLPVNIRQDVCSYERLEEAVAEQFTQRRANVKKELRESLNKKIAANYVELDDSECINIYKLTQSIVKGTRVAVTAELCARVTIMCKAYRKTPGANFWLAVDALMEGIRKLGDYKKERIGRVLLKDRERYGTDNYHIEDGIHSTIQHEVDALVAARNVSPQGLLADEVAQQNPTAHSGSTSSPPATPITRRSSLSPAATTAGGSSP